MNSVIPVSFTRAHTGHSSHPAPGLRIAPGGAQAGLRCKPSAIKALCKHSTQGTGALPSVAHYGMPVDNQQRLPHKMLKSKVLQTGTYMQSLQAEPRDRNVIFSYSKLHETVSPSTPEEPSGILQPELRSRNTVGGEQGNFVLLTQAQTKRSKVEHGTHCYLSYCCICVRSNFESFYKDSKNRLDYWSALRLLCEHRHRSSAVFTWLNFA